MNTVCVIWLTTSPGTLKNKNQYLLSLKNQILKDTKTQSYSCLTTQNLNQIKLIKINNCKKTVPGNNWLRSQNSINIWGQNPNPYLTRKATPTYEEKIFKVRSHHHRSRKRSRRLIALRSPTKSLWSQMGYFRLSNKESKVI